MKTDHYIKALILVIALYSFGVLFNYWETPLGKSPVLDGAENILLGEKIFHGELPNEPFYRAMGYPFLISVLFWLGIEKSLIPMAAGILGVIFHIINTLLIGKCALHVWNSTKARTLTTVLYGFYPIAVYYACDPLDITLANTFSLLSFLFLLLSLKKTQKVYGILSGTFLGIGVFFRPNILPVAGVYGVGLFKEKTRKKCLGSLLALSVILFMGGAINYWHSGDFRVLPWQGSYSLYVANCGNANGKFYRQTIYIPTRSLAKNPARIESEIIYKAETGQNEINAAAFNRFWHKKTYSEILKKPLKWFKLLGKKLIYVFNDFEQHNNKTYSFHKHILPLLAYNPISWGIIFLLAILSFVGLKNRSQASYFLLGFILFLLSGCIIYFASGRFRFLAVPYVVLFTGGIFNFSSQKLKTGLIIVALCCFPVFGNFLDAKNKSTYITDCLLMGHASARQNDFENQFYWANRALQLDNKSLNGIRLKLTAFLNLLFQNGVSTNTSWKQVETEINFLLKRRLIFNDTALIMGAYLWKIKNLKEEAINIWETGRKKFKDNETFEIFLYLVGKRPKVSEHISDNPGSLLWICKVKKGIINTSKDTQRFEQILTFLLGDQITK
jgi:hypothetical protein